MSLNKIQEVIANNPNASWQELDRALSQAGVRAYSQSEEAVRQAKERDALQATQGPLKERLMAGPLRYNPESEYDPESGRGTTGHPFYEKGLGRLLDVGDPKASMVGSPDFYKAMAGLDKAKSSHTFDSLAQAWSDREAEPHEFTGEISSLYPLMGSEAIQETVGSRFPEKKAASVEAAGIRQQTIKDQEEGKTQRAQMTIEARERLANQTRDHQRQLEEIKNNQKVLDRALNEKKFSADMMRKATDSEAKLVELIGERKLMLTDPSVQRNDEQFDAIINDIRGLNQLRADNNFILNKGRDFLKNEGASTAQSETPKPTPKPAQSKPKESSGETYYNLPDSEGGTKRVTESEAIKAIREVKKSSTDDEIRAAIEKFKE